MDWNYFAPPTAITPRTQERVSQLVSQALGNARRTYSPTGIPGVMHHYTTPGGFVGIIQSGMLRASYIAYMNDASEFGHAVRLFAEAARDIDQKSLSPIQKKFVSEFSAVQEVTNFPPHFVSCFSAAENSLNQWRSYGNGEGGFAIGFDTELVDMACGALVRDGSWAWLCPVVYDAAVAKTIINRVLTGALQALDLEVAENPKDSIDKLLENWTKTFISWAIYLCPLFKDPSFHEEKEWRIVYRPRYSTELVPQPRSSGLSGYVNLKVGATRRWPDRFSSDPYVARLACPDKLPIRTLWIGPGPMKTQSTSVAMRFLENYDYSGVTCSTSSIPYRVG